EAWISGAAAAIPRVTVMTVGVALPNRTRRGGNGLGRDIKHAPTHVCDLTNRLGGLALDHHQVSIDVPAPFDWIERSCCLTRRADQLVLGTAGRGQQQRACRRREAGEHGPPSKPWRRWVWHRNLKLCPAEEVQRCMVVPGHRRHEVKSMIYPSLVIGGRRGLDSIVTAKKMQRQQALRGVRKRGQQPTTAAPLYRRASAARCRRNGRPY